MLQACDGCKSLCTSYSSVNLLGGSYSFSPNVDSVKVGDTITIDAIIPAKLRYEPAGGGDSISYDLTGASNVSTEMHLIILDAPGHYSYAMDSVTFSAPEPGTVAPNPQNPSFAKIVSFAMNNGNYLFSVKFVVQKKGVYALSMIDIPQAVKNCDRVTIGLWLSVNDNHQYYLQNIYYQGAPLLPIDQHHSYDFKVY